MTTPKLNSLVSLNIFKEFEKALHNGVVEHKAQTAGERTNASLNEFLTDFIKDVGCQILPSIKCN